MKDGLYMIRKNDHEYLPVYCDMTSEQGAYTLLVTSASNGWKKNEVKLKNPTRPSLSRDYSILGYADQIKALSGGKTFNFVSETNQQTDVNQTKRFNQWQYNWENSLEQRMPWLGARQSLLTTSTHSDYSDWGSIISEKKSNNPAPWIYGPMANPCVIWYWVNEDDCDPSRNPVNGGIVRMDALVKLQSDVRQGVQTRVRQCNNSCPEMWRGSLWQCRDGYQAGKAVHGLPKYG
ncbi:hypothetical protein OS493_039749 [Desmophyllum pertusum]|uniref:Uncharacterized protein n=1 Tax=Desmophyllum pertusum TaxID=174260 RepID=A0A9W9Y838_9CNID|nr:hypothetical protein OS493_039749 [Desmophyllum pertusum]